MNFLFVTTEFPPQPGGIGNHAYNLIESLCISGCNTEIICESRNSNDYEKELKFDNKLKTKIFRLPRKKVVFFRFLIRFKAIFIRTRHFNGVIISSGAWPLFLIGMLRLLKLRNQKTVYIAHGIDINPSNILQRYFCHLCLAYFDEIIAVSNYTKKKLPFELRYKVTVIPNGFDSDRILTRNKLIKNNFPGYPILITIGSISERKGQLNVLNAMPEILFKFPNAHYHMVGLPVISDQIYSLASSLKISNNIHIHGALDDNIMFDLLSKANIFIMLSENTSDGDFEGFGIAILEAAFLGIPSIGSISTGIEDAINNYNSGILVDPHNINMIVDSINNILVNESEYKINAKNHSENFKWEFVTPKYISVFSRLFEK